MTLDFRRYEFWEQLELDDSSSEASSAIDSYFLSLDNKFSPLLAPL